MAAVWADDAVLDELVTVPWGRVPGRAAVWGYIREALVHGWDLAGRHRAGPRKPIPSPPRRRWRRRKRVMPAEPRGRADPVRRAGRPATGGRTQPSSWPTGAVTPAREPAEGRPQVLGRCRCSCTGSSRRARDGGGGIRTGSTSGTCRSRRRTARPSRTPTNTATATHTASVTTIQAIQPHTSVLLGRTSAHDRPTRLACTPIISGDCLYTLHRVCWSRAGRRHRRSDRHTLSARSVAGGPRSLSTVSRETTE